MKPADGITVPLWYAEVEVPTYSNPPLLRQRTDVCVVGAGISGLTTAYFLLKEGKSVIVLDEGEIGSGQTGRTSAHLASANDDRFSEIERLHGLDFSKLSYESNAAAIDLIEKIALDENIDCEFKRLHAYLFSVPGDEPDILEKELAAAHRAGLVDSELVGKSNLKVWNEQKCIRFGNQARFHPLKYLVGLARAIEKMGGTIYTGCRVKEVKGADVKKGTPATATIDEGPGKIEADAIVVATNTPAPINDWMGIYLKQSSYRTYIVTLKVPKGSVPDALFWDTGDPYHYVRLEAGENEDLLIVGGDDHKTGQFPDGTDPFQSLTKWAMLKFPSAGDEAYRWSGQVQEPSDYLAYIGKAPTSRENVYVITGDSGMGLTHGTLGGRLVTDLIQGRDNPWAKIYEPTRKRPDSDLFKENVNTLSQYKDLLTGGDVSSVDQIPAGEGAVIREGLHKIAVYKNETGGVTKCSAVCTHLQCIVHWNGIEKSWDCPCHGSRFDPLGKVLMGPAIEDLPKVQ